MDPATAISLGVTAISTAFSAKGASDSQDAQNKAIKAQNKYDQQVYKYNLQETEDRHQFNINETEIARQNNKRQLAYREKIDVDNYEAAMQQRKKDYIAQSRAYAASEQDYEDYKGLNEDIADQARAETLNKFREQRAGLKYADQRTRVSELETSQNLSNLMRGARNERKDAKAALNLANRSNNRAYNQQTDQLDISKSKLNLSRGTLKKEIDLQEKLGDDKKDTLRTAKDKQIDSLKLTRDRSREAAGQATAEARDAYGDAKLQKQQNVDSIKSKFKRANQGLDQEDRSLDLSFEEQKTVNKQQKAELEANYKAQELQSTFSDERADLKFDSAQDENRIQNAAIRDTLGDQILSANQNIDALTDEELYQLFEVEGNIEALQGSLDANGNRLGGDLNALKFKYESESAARAFEAEANMFEGLSAEGSVAARGQRGKSAARNLSSVMAAIGRQQAQIADSILRGSKIYGSQKKSIEDRIARAETLKTMYGTTTKRKKMDINETYERQERDRDRLIGDQAKRMVNIVNERDLTKDQNERDLENKDENRFRMKGDITERQMDQRARRDLEKKFNAEDLTLNKADKKREIGDQRENLQRAELDKTRTIKNVKANLKLDERAFTEAEKYAKEEFKNSMSKLNKEQRLMMNTLNSQLKQYGIDIKSNKKERKAALQDFKTSQKAAQNTFDSADRAFGLTRDEIADKRINAQTNKLIRQTEYKNSITSAKNAKKSVMQGIRLDEYSANLTADKARMVEPKRSPKPPAPIKYPRTIFQDPRKPGTPPPPVKGAMQSGAVFAALGSGIGKLAQIDWSGPKLPGN